MFSKNSKKILLLLLLIMQSLALQGSHNSCGGVAKPQERPKSFSRIKRELRSQALGLTQKEGLQLLPAPKTNIKLLGTVAEAYLSGQNLRQVGEGGFGFVYQIEIKNPETSEVKKYIIKRNKKSSSTEEECRWIADETALFYFVAAHKNIISYHGAFFVDGKWSLVLEAGEQDLWNLLAETNSDGSISEREISKEQAKQIKLNFLRALRYLHEQGLALNDLKIDNAVLCADVCKLIDFGTVGSLSSRKLIVNNNYNLLEQFLTMSVHYLFKDKKSFDEAKLVTWQDFIAAIEKTISKLKSFPDCFKKNFSKIPRSSKVFMSKILSLITEVEPRFLDQKYQRGYLFINDSWKEILWEYHKSYDQRLADLFALGMIFWRLDICSQYNASRQLRPALGETLLVTNPFKRVSFEKIIEMVEKDEL